jgi:hypothetical protein
MVMWIKLVVYITVVECGLHIKRMLGLACCVHFKSVGYDFIELVCMNIF